MSLEGVSVSLNNIKAKNDELIARFPDEFVVQAIFVEEINRKLQVLQSRKGTVALSDECRLAVDVIYKRHFSVIAGCIGIPSGSFSVTAFNKNDEEIWAHSRQDIVIAGGLIRNIYEIYKVPFGLFRQNEERKYLRIWSEVISEMLYGQTRSYANQLKRASPEAIALRVIFFW